MAKFNVDPYDKKHKQNLIAVANKVKELYMEALQKIAQIGADGKLNDKGWFLFSEHKALEKKIDKVLKVLHDDIVRVTEEAEEESVDISSAKNEGLVEHYGGSNSSRLRTIINLRAIDALEQFQERKIRGMNLSQRVWNLTKQFKQEMELSLELGIGDGVSAQKMAGELRKYLNEPNKLFRRVRDEKGILRLSKAAAAYHPGAGRYRSSYKNAYRTAATETNIAYRSADHEQWKEMDFVRGIEVKTSITNHEVEDICDMLAGEYPKDFKFTGWHPLCRCMAIPLLKSREEMAKDDERILEGEEPLPSKNEVKNLPKNFKEWIKDNADRLESAEKKGTLPYFIRDNDIAREFRQSIQYSTILSKGVNMIPTEIKDLSVVRRNIEIVFANHPEWFSNGYKGIEGMSVNSSYMSTDIKGFINVNFAVDKNGFNAGNCLVSAFEKIEKNGANAKLTNKEEYSLEVLWHEILHNTSKNRTILPPVNDPIRGFERIALETCHQFYARRTYQDFCKKIGYEAKFMDWVKENGYGYKETVKNINLILKKANIKEVDFIQELKPLLMGDYSIFCRELKKVLKKLYNGNGDILRAFDMIEIKDISYYVSNL